MASSTAESSQAQYSAWQTSGGAAEQGIQQQSVPHRDSTDPHHTGYVQPLDSLATGGTGTITSSISSRRESHVSKSTHEKLLRWSTRVIAFLNNLTQDPNGQMTVAGQPKKAAMPISAFAKPKALAFVFRKSYGFLGVGVLNEVGFITKKLVHPDGRVSWSAPYFLCGRGYSVGLTLGRLQTGYCLALLNDEAVDRCLARDLKFGASLKFFVDMDGAYIRPVRIDSTNETDNVLDDGHGGLMAKYFRLEAMMVDCTFNWARTYPFRRLNDSVYGTVVSEDEVLGGTLAGPAEFEGVIDLLNRLSAAGDPRARKPRGKGTPFNDRSFSGRDRSFSGRDGNFSGFQSSANASASSLGIPSSG